MTLQDQAPPSTLTKRELAIAIGWSLPRLDRALLADLDFPVIQRGGRGVGWAFDLDAVRTHVARVNAEKTAADEAARRKRRANDPAEKLLNIQAHRIEQRVADLAGQYVERVGIEEMLDETTALLRDWHQHLMEGARALEFGPEFEAFFEQMLGHILGAYPKASLAMLKDNPVRRRRGAARR